MGSDDGIDVLEVFLVILIFLGGGFILINGDLVVLSLVLKSGFELGVIIGIVVGCGLVGFFVVLGIIWFVVCCC